MTDVTTPFGLILDGLCRVLAAHAARNPAMVPLILILWGRLRRTVARFAVLVEAFQAGRLPAPRAGGPAPRGAGTAPPRPWPHLPDGFGWLIRRVPGTSVFGSQLRHLLTDPDMAALVAASPGARRMLRPLCRMLGIPPGPTTVPPYPKRPPPPSDAPAAGATPPTEPPQPAPPPGLAPTGLAPTGLAPTGFAIDLGRGTGPPPGTAPDPRTAA